MRALLDTHTFLWWNMDDPQLSIAARQFIADGRNELFFSAASGSEIAIKAARGKLPCPKRRRNTSLAAWRGIAFNLCQYNSATPCASMTCPSYTAILSTAC